MNIIDLQNYWIKSSNSDYESAKILFKKKKYVQSMFFLHLAIEKMLKAMFVKRNSSEPPHGHNLQNIANKINNITIDNDIMKLFTEITTFNIASRYDDYKNNFYILCDKKFAKHYLDSAKGIFSWIKYRMK